MKKPVDKKDNSIDKSGGLRRRRLKELAVEASRHLDEILPGGDASDEGKTLVRSGHVRPDDDSTGDLRSGSRGSHTDKSGGSRPSAVKDETAASVKTSAAKSTGAAAISGRAAAGSNGAAAGFARATTESARVAAEFARAGTESSKVVTTTSDTTPEAGRGLLGRAGARDGMPTALVVHVSHGVAMVLANLLKHMGVYATVVTSPDEAEARMDEGPWDMLFVQGTSKPYPGKELASLVLDRCSPSKPDVVLLTRAGDALLADAGRWSAVGLLEWPFSPERVGKILAAVMPKMKSGRLRQG